MLLLPILNYHHVGVRVEPKGHRRLWVSIERFSQHMAYLEREGYRCLTLRECLPYFSRQSPLPQPSVVLTFDDGYSDFIEHAYPILRQHGFGATIAIVTGDVGKISRWDSQWASPIMSWPDIIRLSQDGIEVASHTVTHPRLSQLSPDEAERELIMSRNTLEDKLGASVVSLVYPYGDVNTTLEEAAKRAGYLLATSSGPGNLHRPSDLFRLRRVPLDEFMTIPRLRRKLSSFYHYTCRFQQLTRRWFNQYH